jgi:hypothetical protein
MILMNLLWNETLIFNNKLGTCGFWPFSGGM